MMGRVNSRTDTTEKLRMKLDFVKLNANEVFLHYPLILRSTRKPLNFHVNNLVFKVWAGRKELLHFHPNTTSDFDDRLVLDRLMADGCAGCAQSLSKKMRRMQKRLGRVEIELKGGENVSNSRNGRWENGGVEADKSEISLFTFAMLTC